MIHYEDPDRRRKKNAVETVAATDCGIRLRTSTGEASTPSATSTPSSTSTTDESRRALDARGLADSGVERRSCHHIDSVLASSTAHRRLFDCSSSTSSTASILQLSFLY